MNKKAFTLVEVLAVIVILTLIAGITIPSVSYAIKTNKIKKYEITEENLTKYLTLYNLDYEEKLWNDSTYCIGNTCNVPYNEIKNKYKNFSLPKECQVDKLIIERKEKVGKYNYEYQACMICKENSLVIYESNNC